MREQFLTTLPMLDMRRDQRYNVPGSKQFLPGQSAGPHLVFADPWSKGWGQPDRHGKDRSRSRIAFSAFGRLLGSPGSNSEYEVCPVSIRYKTGSDQDGTRCQGTAEVLR